MRDERKYVLYRSLVIVSALMRLKEEKQKDAYAVLSTKEVEENDGAIETEENICTPLSRSCLSICSERAGRGKKKGHLLHYERKENTEGNSGGYEMEGNV